MQLGTSHFVHFVQNPLQLLQLPDLFPDELRYLRQPHFKILQEGLHGVNLQLTHSDCEPVFSNLDSVLHVCVVGLQPLAQCTIGLALVDLESFDLG